MLEESSLMEQKLRGMLQYAPVALIEISMHGEVLEKNLKAEDWMKYLEPAIGLQALNIFPALEWIRPQLSQQITQFAKKIGVVFSDMFILSPDGTSERYFNITAHKQFDGTFMVTIDDITERQQREKAVRQAELEIAVEQGKYEIAADVLHDIGNAIVGFGSYLTRIKRMQDQHTLDNLQKLAGFFEAQQAAFATTLGDAKAKAVTDMLKGILRSQQEKDSEIANAVQEQLNIISHVQEILNIQRQYVSGHESHERKPVNLRSIINDSVSMLYATCQKRGIMISLSITANDPIIKGDRTKLMQVLLNVMKNSMEAIAHDAREKTIEIELAQTMEHALVLKITDTGTGFDEATGNNMFKRGFTTKSSGTGLGLYNCKTIIESHAGTIRIDSEGPGSGARTTIEFRPA
ncbi:MAG: PAS domain-containing sensor histidine kinase [Sphingobacteriales bacterium]|nr:MAG: PAS domain-containing sensor histidine kinase [Sphingobacteriales bacterium]